MDPPQHDAHADLARVAPVPVKPSEAVGAHKLYSPPVQPGAIQRNAVLDRIFANEGARVVVLQGPAGHGKSVLLRQAKSLCEAQGHATGWLTLDEADNDKSRFSLHLQALLSAALGPASQSAPESMNEPARSRWRSDWLINQLLSFGRPVSLFFDELQWLSDKSILGFFRDTLERIPANVTVYIGSRSVPEIGLSRLLVNGRATVLRAEDLRFSEEEVARFFLEAQHLWISLEEIQAIYRQTEGWPAALQLFRLTLVSPAVRKSLGELGSYRPRELAEYLADNVLTLQPPRIQEFLLRTSLLTRLSAPLCDAVTGWHNSQEILLYLERSGLFVQNLDSDSRWFRYHTLFSSCLTEQLRSVSPDTVIEVHQRAARWYQAQQHFDDAIHHAVEIQDYAVAADVLNIWATRLIAEAHLMTVERWADQLPPEEIEKRPDLAIKIAYALTFLRRHQKLKPILTMLERLPQGDLANVTNPDVVRAMAAIMVDDLPAAFECIRRVNVYNQTPEGFAAFELGAAANLTGYFKLASGDFEGARECLALAYAYSEKTHATFSAGYAIGVIGANFMVQGQLGEALARYRAGMSKQGLSFDKSFAPASLVAVYLQALYWADELDTAESLFNQFHDAIAESVLLDFLAVAYISMARIHDVRGQAGKALEMLDEAETIGHANRWPRLNRIVNWERVRRAVLRGESGLAESIATRLRASCERAKLGNWILFSEDCEGDVIGEIRLAIHRASTEEALSMIADELALAEPRGRIHRQIKLHVLGTLTRQQQGDGGGAKRSLRRALQLAQHGGFVRSFLDEGKLIPELLHREQASLQTDGNDRADPGISSEFLKCLLKAAGVESGESGAMNPKRQLDALTDREKEILIFLANGVSNREMAGRIFVSENTVKFHLKNIYSKLAVCNRMQAINTARQIGLIS